MVEHTRTLDFKVAFAIGLGTMIAAGIFSLSGTAVAEIGSSAVIAFIIAAVIAGITAASYSEFASIYSENGGGYLFSSRTFDNTLLLYGVGVSLFMGYCATTAFYLGTMDHWVTEFVIPHSIPVPPGVVGALTAAGLGYLNAQGTEESGTFQVIVTGAKVAVLLAFIGGAVAYAGPTQSVGTFTTGFQWEPMNIVSIASVAFITFFGFSAIAASAGEIIEPRRTVPLAIAASIITVTILYTLVIVAMVNAPVGNEVLQAGETAMGKVAASFMGSIGQALIVAGAIFSMVSASNASILAASGIGNLMGQQGQAPRRLSRIHPEYNTPFWSVTTVTATIVTLVVVFVSLFPAEGGLGFLHLGLNALTGFANVNLLAPLAVVNVALIYSRRRSPDIDRPFSVPFSPWLPILGILANIALIASLPPAGIAIGVLIELALVGVYLVWGGGPHVEDIMQRTVPTRQVEASATGGASSRGQSGGTEATAGSEPEIGAQQTVETAGAAETAAEDAEGFRVLVPVARTERAVEYVRLAAQLGHLLGAGGGRPRVQVVNVTQIPEQTPSESVEEVAVERASRLETELEGVDVDATVTVEGHICQDVAFDILQTARDDGADRILMGYPEDHPAVAEEVEYNAPCPTLFVSNIPERLDASVVNIGAGGGPHHESLLPLANAMAEDGAEVHVINVAPASGGTEEDVQSTLAAFDESTDVEVHEVEADTVADGLVSAAAENGGLLLIGATRTRLLRRWVFGSTPDRVIELADQRDVPVIVYADSPSLSGFLKDAVFTAYRPIRKLTS